MQEYNQTKGLKLTLMSKRSHPLLGHTWAPPNQDFRTLPKQAQQRSMRLYLLEVVNVRRPRQRTGKLKGCGSGGSERNRIEQKVIFEEFWQQ